MPAEPLPSTDSQAPRHDPNPRHGQTVDGSNEPLPDRTSSEKRPARLQRAAKVGGTTSDESPHTYQFPVTGSWTATRSELHSLECDACWHHGNHTREDCPVRLRSSCLFCGSTEHRRGVDCTKPHVYGRFVVACRVEAFKRKSPKEQRRALQATHRRASPLAVVGGGIAVDGDASADGTDGSGATSSSGTRRARSARTRAAAGSNARTAADEAAAMRVRLTEALDMHHADKAALHELKRENAALRAQNAALHAANAPHTGTTSGSAGSNDTALRSCEREIARLRQELAGLGLRHTALLAADTERRRLDSLAARTHALSDRSSPLHDDVVQCYASGVLFPGPGLAPALDRLRRCAKDCDGCQAATFVAQHRVLHDRIRFRRYDLLPSVTQAAQQPEPPHAQRDRAQHDTRRQHDAAPQRGRTDVHGHTRSDTPHAGARGMGGYAVQPVVTTDADGYTTPLLRDQPGLLCCRVGCDNNVHRLWFYHASHIHDRRRVCGCCVARWPDLRRNFDDRYLAYDCSRQPAGLAAAKVQRAFRRFIVRTRAAKLQERMAGMSPGCRYAPRALHDRVAATRAAADEAALELQRVEAMPHGHSVSGNIDHRHSVAQAARAAESSSQLAVAVEARLQAAMLAARRLRANAHVRHMGRALLTWHAHAATRLARQARAVHAVKHARSRLLLAALCSWRTGHAAARTRILRADELWHKAGVRALRAVLLGWRVVAAAALTRRSSVLLARRRARIRLLRAALQAWSPRKAMGRGAMLTAPRRPPGSLGIWLRLAWQ